MKNTCKHTSIIHILGRRHNTYIDYGQLVKSREYHPNYSFPICFPKIQRHEPLNSNSETPYAESCLVSQ